MAASSSSCWAVAALILFFSLPLSIAADPSPTLDTFIVQTHNSGICPESKCLGMFGLSVGTARGVAPKAKLAMYKACWMGGCYDSDLLAAMDSAIEDGVDLISISISQSTDYPYHSSALAAGSEEVVKRGVFVALAAGNQGPGNGEVIYGQSLYSKEVDGNEEYPLIYVPFCDSGSLVADKVKGRVGCAMHSQV